MEIIKPSVIELFRGLKQIAEAIPAGFSRGYPLSKSFLMAYIALKYDLKNYVEIGAYKGRSFFPMAYAAKLMGGMAYGIDPYDPEIAKEYDREEDTVQKINQFVDTVGFPEMYQNVIDLGLELKLDHCSKIIREKSSSAVRHFERNSIDMLHIAGNHDAQYGIDDVDLYFPLVKDGGFIVVDDINWDSVKPIYRKLQEVCHLVFSDANCAILYKGNPKESMSFLDKRRLNILHSLVENVEQDDEIPATNIPKVSVIVLSYDQEEYIAECLEGILAQKGEFLLELVIGDDHSSDRTLEIIKSYLDNFRHRKMEVNILSADKNLGMTPNFKRCWFSCNGDYIAFCEGDDYWTHPYKLQKQIDFLKSHPACALCFNDLHVYFQGRGEYSTSASQQQLAAEVITTRDIILKYSIGNLSCCMYDARYASKIPTDLFDLVIGDWMFNIFYSQFGDIGHVKGLMSVYRKHKKGVSAGKATLENVEWLYENIDQYNRYLNYKYDREFTLFQKRLAARFPEEFHKDPWDLAIIDGMFPNPLSAFRRQEFESYLDEFQKIRVYTSGSSILNFKPIEELIADFKKRSPKYAHQIEIFKPDTIINAKLVYLVFLGNAYQHIRYLEKLKIPFVFTLYPGGRFGLNNTDSDRMLKRVTSSPCFRKVIVTQQITYNYLIENKYCAPEQIEYIFGVVAPIQEIEAEYTDKKHFGFGKDTLDICFVAAKYTEKGVDKGYDVFIDVAKKLCEKYDNIRFHVVGGFDEQDIDVTAIKDRITFYGYRPTEWFDAFYKDKDIILSPNTPFMIHEGQFDGFPTGTCVDAGLRKTAVFCTDELHLNKHFIDHEEIVIIPHDVIQVVGILEGYYRDPEKLERIAEAGCHKIKNIYGYEAQILPRINILKKEIAQAEGNVEREQALQLLLSKKVKYPQAVQKLTVQLAEREKKLREVEKELREIKSSKAWKFALLLRRIRTVLVPPNNLVVRMSRRLLNFARGGKIKEDLVLIRSSDLFDEVWYLAKNPDVAHAKVDPALHYLRHGGLEGRNPSPDFDGNWYLEAYQDVKKAGVNPLVHYLKYGKAEGRLARHQRTEVINFLYKCPVCQKQVDMFSPISPIYEETLKKYGAAFTLNDFETLNVEQYTCPHCAASDRCRLYACYLEKKLPQYQKTDEILLLDIAPSRPLNQLIDKFKNIVHHTADLFDEDVDFRIDITDMPAIASNSYDILICSHVLEHVSDDGKALSELYRVLKHGGWGIVMVPINLAIQQIDEDPQVIDIGERWSRFGQGDHIRMYSRHGFIERVEEAGFILKQLGIDYFGKSTFGQYGIAEKSMLYIVEKI